MLIHQFYDQGLAQASYAIISEGQMAVIDPARNINPYYDYAKEHNAKIVAVIETHLHADFVSSHLEIAAATGAKVYVSRIAEVQYPHEEFDDGSSIRLGKVTLSAMNTPGHFHITSGRRQAAVFCIYRRYAFCRRHRPARLKRKRI